MALHAPKHPRRSTVDEQAATTHEQLLDRLFADSTPEELWMARAETTDDPRGTAAEPEPEVAIATVATPPRAATERVASPRPGKQPRLSTASLLMLLGGLLFSGFCLACGLTAPPQAHEVTRLVPVATEVRRTTRMDHIRRDDIVLARDEYGTEIGPRRVVQVFRRESDHLRHLTFRAEDGREQTLRTTDEHPFWVAGLESYVEARFLEPGVEVVTPDGQRQTLVSTCREEHPEGIAVFNFEVEETHTYFVSEDGVADAVLVHNECKVVPVRSLYGRQHKSEFNSNHLKRLKRSMRDNGFDARYPIRIVEVDGRRIIIDGHHRARAAGAIGIRDVPVVVENVSPEQAA